VLAGAKSPHIRRFVSRKLLYNGQYLDATFSAVDFGLALALSTAGPLGIAADVGLNAAGGSKAAAKGLASGICMIGGGT
jgi:hypothetical protein